MRSALPAFLLLASCAGSGPGGAPEGPAAADLQILSDLDPASPDPIEGGLGLFSVAVRNASKRFVILRDLALPDGTPILTWVNPPPKPLQYDNLADEFRAEAGPRSENEMVQIGALFPGETVIFRPQVRLLNLPQRYAITYHSYSPEEVSQKVYFEVQGGGPLKYRRKAAADVATIPSVKEPAATHRTVIFPYAWSITEEPRTAELVLDVPTPPRKFRLTDALRKANLQASDVLESTFCVYLDSWAVRTRARSLLITSRAVTPLPRISGFELCFFHLDSIESHLPVQFEFSGALEVRFPDRRITPLRDADRTRKLAFIPREEVAEFLREVADKGLEIFVRAEGRGVSLVLRPAGQAGEPALPFRAAMKRAGLTATDVVEHVWSQALAAWAVRTKSQSWVLAERGPGRLPAIPWFAYFFKKLDEAAAAGDVMFVLPAEDIDFFPYAPGGKVKPADLSRFLTGVQERGLSIEVSAADKSAPFRLRR